MENGTRFGVYCNEYWPEVGGTEKQNKVRGSALRRDGETNHPFCYRSNKWKKWYNFAFWRRIRRKNWTTTTYTPLINILYSKIKHLTLARVGDKELLLFLRTCWKTSDKTLFFYGHLMKSRGFWAIFSPIPGDSRRCKHNHILLSRRLPIPQEEGGLLVSSWMFERRRIVGVENTELYYVTTPAYLQEYLLLV